MIQRVNLLVTIETEVAIKINPSIAYSTLLKEFSECIFEIETFTELFKFIAERIAVGDRNFIEGIGRIEYDYGQDFAEDTVVIYSIPMNDTDVIALGTEYD